MKKLAFIFVLSFVNTIFSQHTLKYIPQSRKDSLEILFLIKLNNYRKQNNLPSLSIDKIVTKAALEQAEYCATIGMQTHNNPNPNLTKKTFSSYAENAISGYIENTGTAYDDTYDNDTIALNPDFLMFEHTDGLNYENIEFRRLDVLFGRKNFAFSATEGLGAGVLVPRTNTTLLNNARYDEFHLAGYGTGFIASIRLPEGSIA